MHKIKSKSIVLSGIKKLWIGLLLFLLFLLPNQGFAQRQHKHHVNWWLEKYGALEPDTPSVEHIRKTIFPRVRAAADKNGSHPPELYILKEAGGNLALCIEEGIILTQKAIDICYRAVDRRTGDARVAFILGHELSHLYFRDFEKTAAPGKDPRNPSVADTAGDLITIPETEENSTRKQKERRADLQGFLYSLLAGYNPRMITGENNFFKEWYNGVHDSHPAPDRRLEEILSMQEDLLRNLDLFDIGTRLYQLGRYDDALAFLRSFNKKFPSREAYNVIGLIHFQKAVLKLTECDPDAAFRFKPALSLDRNTRLPADLSPKSFRGVHCDTRSLFDDAVWYFKEASDKDRFYIPSRINSASALLMQGKYASAKGVIEDEVLTIGNDYPNAMRQNDYLKAMNNLGIAVYLYGSDHYLKVDMFDDALKIFNAILDKDPDDPDAYYNLGRINAERKRNGAARRHWERFLELEPYGIYAGIAGKEVGREGAAAPRARAFAEPPPIDLGLADRDTEEQLAGYTLRYPDIGTVRYSEYYIKEDTWVLIQAGVVEVVECPVIRKMEVAALEDRYGKPQKTFEQLSGVSTLVYQSFAVDVSEAGIVEKVIHFQAMGPDRN